MHGVQKCTKAFDVERKFIINSFENVLQSIRKLKG